MKALILNSGLGTRLQELTKDKPKCMLKLYNGESILERQIRILSEFGIRDFIITTGPFEEQLHKVAQNFKNLNFVFIQNKEYKTTNYIFSIYNAREFLDDDILLLHGDLVFNKAIISKVLNSPIPSLCLYNEEAPLPKKDFKGKFKNNKLLEVSIDIFDDDCFAFQPLYKLSKQDISLWKNEISNFIHSGKVNVYAENALNEILSKMNIIGMSYKDDYMQEVDNKRDYFKVFMGIKPFDRKEQNIQISDDLYQSIKNIVAPTEKVFIVCSKRLLSEISESLNGYNFDIFSDFSPNPKYQDIKNGVKKFEEKRYDFVISIGGGSAIDTAKCIKAFSKTNSRIKHIAVPTTAGSGSESTQFAVMYKNNKKVSIDYPFLLPGYVILCPKVLNSLPDYQKKSTLLDALCQAIESFWAKTSSAESKEYSKKCIHSIINNYKGFLNGEESSYEPLLIASNFSGKAINITRTTAAHAMSYKLSTDYKISHGHAVALCLIPLWELLYKKSKRNNALKATLEELSSVFCVNSIPKSIEFVSAMIESFDLPKINIPALALASLVEAVNPERLSNTPVFLNNYDIHKMYGEIS